MRSRTKSAIAKLIVEARMFAVSEWVMGEIVRYADDGRSGKERERGWWTVGI